MCRWNCASVVMWDLCHLWEHRGTKESSSCNKSFWKGSFVYRSFTLRSLDYKTGWIKEGKFREDGTGKQLSEFSACYQLCYLWTGSSERSDGFVPIGFSQFTVIGGMRLFKFKWLMSGLLEEMLKHLSTEKCWSSLGHIHQHCGAEIPMLSKDSDSDISGIWFTF